MTEASVKTLLNTARALRTFVQKRGADEALLLRILETEIEILALEITSARPVKGAGEILLIKSSELEERLAALIGEALGYYGLVLEPFGEGNNEPPVDSAEARVLRSTALRVADLSATENRDRLAKKLSDTDS